MKARLNQAIEITLRPSLLLLGLLVGIAILSCVILTILPMSFAIKLLLMMIIVFSTLYFILRDGLLALPWSWQQVQVSSLGELRLINQQGQQFKPSLQASTFIHPQLVILNTKTRNPKKWFNFSLPPVIVFPSNDQQHRQLRVWLKWWKHEEER
jgi:hypothetical protein